MKFALALLVLLPVLGGCMGGNNPSGNIPSTATAIQSSSITILPPNGDFDTPGGWFLWGEDDALLPIAGGGAPVIRLTQTGDGVTVGRLVDLPLTQMPILYWRWRLYWQTADHFSDAPVRIVVGFHGGAETELRETDGLPEHQRAVMLVWSRAKSAAGRWDVRGAYGRQVVNSGESFADWKINVISLAELHSRLWPDIAPEDVNLAFVAVNNRAGNERLMADISGLVLTR